MSDETGISWADSTFNPWVGCAKVSPGCAHCYAETWSNRYNRAVWGETGSRVRTSAGTWAKPLKWERDHEAFEAEHGHRRRVFCASLADVFEERPTLDEWREDLFMLILATPHLDWLLLTKRPDVAIKWSDTIAEFPNVWMGTSIENSRFSWRVEFLRGIPAAKRFISAEPLLGSVMLSGVRSHNLSLNMYSSKPLDLTGIDWVIVGGESGGREARPMHPHWVREIRDAVLWMGMTPCGDGCCEPPAERPALHFKQWGSYSPASSAERGTDVFVVEENGTFRKSSEALPSPSSAFMRYRGSLPTAGGKLLDGVEWREVP